MIVQVESPDLEWQLVEVTYTGAISASVICRLWHYNRRGVGGGGVREL